MNMSVLLVPICPPPPPCFLYASSPTLTYAPYRLDLAKGDTLTKRWGRRRPGFLYLSPCRLPRQTGMQTRCSWGSSTTLWWTPWQRRKKPALLRAWKPPSFINITSLSSPIGHLSCPLSPCRSLIQSLHLTILHSWWLNEMMHCKYLTVQLT